MNYREAASDGPLVVAFGGHVFGVDAASGQTLWERSLGGHTPRIIVTDSQVFVGGDKILCLAYPSGEVVWEQQDVLRGATFLLAGGKLYAGSFGEVTCYSAADGKRLWTNKFPGKGRDSVALGTPFNTMQMDLNT